MLKYFQRAPKPDDTVSEALSATLKGKGKKVDDVSENPTPLKAAGVIEDESGPAGADTKYAKDSQKLKDEIVTNKSKMSRVSRREAKGNIADAEDGTNKDYHNKEKHVKEARTATAPHSTPRKGSTTGDVAKTDVGNVVDEKDTGDKDDAGEVTFPSATRASPRKVGPVRAAAAVKQNTSSSKNAEIKTEKQYATSEMSEYEQLRERNIARNNELLESLSIAQLPAPAKEPTSGGGKKRKAKDWSVKPEQLDGRRSSRISKQAKEADLAALPETWDESDERERRGSKKPKVLRDEYEDEEQIDAANLVPPPSMSEFQEELLRLQLEALPHYAGHGDVDWEAFARRQWGSHAGVSKSGEQVEDWKVFVASRCPVLPDVMGSGMLQEDYCADCYRLIVACLLMSRVSSHDCKSRCINGFFAAFPTPSDVKNARDVEIEAIIKPLGLSESRIKSVREVTTFWLEQKRFQIGLEKPIKPCGVGPFTYESYLIFCCGQGRLVTTNDKALSGYCSWLRRQPTGQTGRAHPLVLEAIPL